MPARDLILASAGIAFSMGLAHLVLTFVGPRFLPRDPSLKTRMVEVAPVISKDTTMWKAWIGFNASHSMGVMLFGLIYGYLAIAQTGVLLGSPYLLTLGLAMLGGYLVLAKLYWFRIPLAGISASFLCFVAGVIASKV